MHILGTEFIEDYAGARSKLTKKQKTPGGFPHHSLEKGKCQENSRGFLTIHEQPVPLIDSSNTWVDVSVAGRIGGGSSRCKYKLGRLRSGDKNMPAIRRYENRARWNFSLDNVWWQSTLTLMSIEYTLVRACLCPPCISRVMMGIEGSRRDLAVVVYFRPRIVCDYIDSPKDYPSCVCLFMLKKKYCPQTHGMRHID